MKWLAFGIPLCLVVCYAASRKRHLAHENRMVEIVENKYK